MAFLTSWATLLLVLIIALLGAAAYGIMQLRARRRRGLSFLHPSSGGGGGGERVLWIAIRAAVAHNNQRRIDARVLKKPLPPPVILYTRRYGASKEDLLATVDRQFGVRIDPDAIETVFLWSFDPVDPKNYPRLTLVLQTFFGGFLVALNVALRGCSDRVVETVGIPAVCPLLRYIIGVKMMASYVHYPIVSQNMIDRVAHRSSMYNNDDRIARSSILSNLKIHYFRAIAVLYGWCLRSSSPIMVNSSWTSSHVRPLLKGRDPIVLFPPCNVKRQLTFPPSGRRNAIVSIGQFRPEKNHRLQVEAFAAAIPRLPEDATLYLVGGARNEEDRARVADLQKLVKELSLEGRVIFEVSAPLARVEELLATSCVGLHAMQDEHFGIVVVEYMASGLIPIAHRSGGVELDIVRDKVDGRLCVTKSEYAEAMVELFSIKQRDAAAWQALQFAARERVDRFSDEKFATKFVEVCC